MGTPATGGPKPLNVRNWLIGFVLALLLEIGIVVVILIEFPAHASAVSTAALFAVLTGSALTIERIIELGWTVVGLTKGTWWPLTKVGTSIDALVNGITAQIQPFYDQAQALIDKLTAQVAADEEKLNTAPDAEKETIKAAIKAGKEQLAKANQALDSFKADLTRLRELNLSTGTGMTLPDFKIYIDATTARVDQLRGVLKDVGDLSPLADQALDVLSSLVGSFKDNPGRRFISLFVGMMLGVAVSAILGLDIFQVPAENVVEASRAGSGQDPYAPSVLGVVVSGLVIGLGSSPTHEIVKLVQETKRRFKGENAAAG